MPALIHVVVIDCNSFERKMIRFSTIDSAIRYVNGYPCRGHIVFAVRYDVILALKSDMAPIKYVKEFSRQSRIYVQ